jgi:predicted ArsR family transcriptional regulator
MGKKKSKINLNQLRIEIQYMTVRRQLYKVLKEELTKLGYWKKRKRGKPNPMFTKR